MSVKEYGLKFHELSQYTLEMVFIIWDRMHKFSLGQSREALGLSHNFDFKSKIALFINDMEISRLVV